MTRGEIDRMDWLDQLYDIELDSVVYRFIGMAVTVITAVINNMVPTPALGIVEATADARDIRQIYPKSPLLLLMSVIYLPRRSKGTLMPSSRIWK